MKYFTQLFTDLDQTTKTLDKIKALVNYFEQTNDQDDAECVIVIHRADQLERRLRVNALDDEGRQRVGVAAERAR